MLEKAVMSQDFPVVSRKKHKAWLPCKRLGAGMGI
jgi:hypothetical protein